MNNVNLGSMVDKLGRLNAKIAELEKETRSIKEVLCKYPGEKIPGKLFSATVVESTRETLDSDLVKAYYTLQGVRVPVKLSYSTSVRITARQVETA